MIWLTPAFSVNTGRLPGVGFEPIAVRGAAGEIDQLDVGPQRKLLRRIVAGGVRHERNHVGIEARFGEHLAGDAYRDRQGQDRGGMRLHHDRVAGCEVGEETRISIPCRKRAAANDKADTARHDSKSLFHSNRLALALRFFPQRFCRNAAQLVPRIRDGLETAVLRMGTRRLKGHQKRLARGVHHRVGHHKTLLVDPLQDFETDTDPRFRSGLAPLGFGFGDRREQCVDIGLRVRDAEREAIGRTLAANGANGAGLVQRKRLVAQGIERCLAGFRSAFAIDFGARRFRKRAPVCSLGDGGERALEPLPMAVE
jgi:hypothetical protein